MAVKALYYWAGSSISSKSKSRSTTMDLREREQIASSISEAFRPGFRGFQRAKVKKRIAPALFEMEAASHIQYEIYSNMLAIIQCMYCRLNHN